MNRRLTRGLLGLAAAMVVGWAMPASAQNLFTDPSFEKPIPRNRFGHVMAEWSGWIFEAASCFEVGQVARTGNTSLEIIGAAGGKIRMYSKEIPLAAGRYRLRLHLRGLDIGQGRWGTNIDLSVDQAKFVGIKKSGTFGWTPMTYVFDAPEGLKLKLAFGLWEDGRLWVDDASLEQVGNDVALTPKPEFGAEEKPVAMPGALPEQPVRCPDYMVAPRYWHPTPAPASPGVTRNFFIRLKTAPDAAAGTYKGTITIKPARGPAIAMPVEIKVLDFALDPVTDVAAGPWGCSISCGWPPGLGKCSCTVTLAVIPTR